MVAHWPFHQRDQFKFACYLTEYSRSAVSDLNYLFFYFNVVIMLHLGVKKHNLHSCASESSKIAPAITAGDTWHKSKPKYHYLKLSPSCWASSDSIHYTKSKTRANTRAHSVSLYPVYTAWNLWLACSYWTLRSSHAEEKHELPAAVDASYLAPCVPSTAPNMAAPR